MLNIRYTVVKDTLLLENVYYSTYGILILKNNKPFRYIYDVFPDIDKAEGLVKLCNELKLSPIHIYEVVEDFIS